MMAMSSEFKHVSLVLHSLLSHNSDFKIPVVLHGQSSASALTAMKRQAAKKSCWSLPPFSYSSGPCVLWQHYAQLHCACAEWWDEGARGLKTSPCSQDLESTAAPAVQKGMERRSKSTWVLRGPSAAAKGLRQGRTQSWVLWVPAETWLKKKKKELWLKAKEEMKVKLFMV